MDTTAPPWATLVLLVGLERMLVLAPPRVRVREPGRMPARRRSTASCARSELRRPAVCLYSQGQCTKLFSVRASMSCGVVRSQLPFEPGAP
ncbi:hypothetical protein PF003_g2971 [Phytophthora fragariae]|nr:hypothetical protein PF003_g2971 [Phytophthora fragariae]